MELLLQGSSWLFLLVDGSTFGKYLLPSTTHTHSLYPRQKQMTFGQCQYRFTELHHGDVTGEKENPHPDCVCLERFGYRGDGFFAAHHSRVYARVRHRRERKGQVENEEQSWHGVTVNEIVVRRWRRRVGSGRKIWLELMI